MTVSMRVMSAGQGYRYLLNTVVVGDGFRDAASALTRYYAEKGTPPGRWIGSGLSGLTGPVAAGEEVTGLQLQRLIGDGQEPNTGEQLGRPYRSFASTADRITARTANLPAALTGNERARQRAAITVEEEAKTTGRPVAGFDLTFSVPKSVSALWAVADGGTQALIVQAHHQAVADVIDLVERDVAMTRIGAAGPRGAVAQVEVRGVVGAGYDHYDSRASDPQLHTHVVIANRVQAVRDGKWRTLDSRALHGAVVGLSEHYNAVLSDHLAGDLDVGWEARDRGVDRSTAWEITGVPQRLMDEFSSRSHNIETEKDRLIADYADKHGRQPSTRMILKLRQQATLATRPKKIVSSLAELTVQWRDRAQQILGEEGPTWASQVSASSLEEPLLRADDIPLTDLDRVAEGVVAAVGTKRTTWRRWNLHAEAVRQTMGLRFVCTGDREAVLGLIVDAAEHASTRLTPPELARTPPTFRREEGVSVFRPKASAIYSSEQILAAEDRLLHAATIRTAPTLPVDVIEPAARCTDRHERSLSTEQEQAIAKIVVSGRILDVLVGPAGTGKTTTMSALRRAWEQAHGAGSVLGLAPSAAAAQVLADDLHIATENTAKWLYEHQVGTWNLTAGQLVIIDEASLAGTLALDRIATHAAGVGAKVLLVGDWAQLTAVDAGGAFGMLVRDRDDAPELLDVRRFHNRWEKTASLQLRIGDTDAIDTYLDRNRVVSGGLDDVMEAAYHTWRADLQAGRRSVLITETHDTVTALNARARTDRILAGDVQPGGITLRDGNQAGRGDLVITRKNDRRLVLGKSWVKNGDHWRVLQTHDDGSVTIQRADTRWGGTITVPAAYVAEHLDLGYAITAHRAQGSTVDTAHAIVHSNVRRPPSAF